VAWLFGDRGIPATWRHMNGYGSHTYSWINADGQIFWMKYHFISDQGIDCLTQEEADRLVSVDGDYHTRDLHEAIKRGDYPTWTLKVQIMPFEDAKTYRFNPFDLTKVWPHADYPLIEVGKLVLNRNYTDHHTQIEQAAFAPSNQVPGTGFSTDKMLLARTFAYADAHRARIGVNYKQIPVNDPRCPVHSYSKDGAMRVIPVSDPVYAPNSKGGPQADPARAAEVLWHADGDMMRTAYTLRADDDDWGQAGHLAARRDGRRGATPADAQRGRPPPERGDGAGLGACLRVLEKHRRRNRRENRSGRAQRIVLTDDPDTAGRWRETAPGEPRQRPSHAIARNTTTARRAPPAATVARGGRRRPIQR
jgi:catalase